jgi:hypothetical protein
MALVILGIVLAMKKPILGVVALSAPIGPLTEFLGMRSKLKRGDVNPAVVVSQRPWRIAVLTDLGADGRSAKPAIKVQAVPSLGRMTGGPPELGMRLAAVCLYVAPATDGAWLDFTPTVLACATNSEADLLRTMASIPAYQWATLEGKLGSIATDRHGLYKLWQGSRNVYARSLFRRIAISIGVAIVVLVGLFWVAYGVGWIK